MSMRLFAGLLLSFPLLTYVQVSSVFAQETAPETAPETAQAFVSGGADWPQWGGTNSRMNTPVGKNIPSSWIVGVEKRAWTAQASKKGHQPAGSQNIKWAVPLGSETFGNPVVAGGKVFVGTNNAAGYVKRFPPEVDLGVLLCFEEATGNFLWQHSNQKLETGRVHDWPDQGVCSTPVVDGNRLWYVSNRGEVVCLDTEGYHDDEDDGVHTVRPLQAFDKEDADIVWRFDMMKELGVSQHNMATCSMLYVDDLLYVCTSNGVDEGHRNIPASQAPSFFAMHRDTGQVVWTDNSPGENILHAQWASPSYGVFNGQPQVIFPGGDGWLYSFDPKGDGNGGSKLLWKFDGNPKSSRYEVSGSSTRNHFIGFAAIYDGLVYIAVGEDPEHGEGEGHLWCIDPTKRLDGGDVSPELAVDQHGNLLAPRRWQAINPQLGERAIPNPDSAAVWHYVGRDVQEFEETFHRSISTPVIQDDVLYIADYSGLLHCLHAKTGQAYWTYDCYAACWSSPMLVEGKVYMAGEVGEVAIFRHTDKPRVAHFPSVSGESQIATYNRTWMQEGILINVCDLQSAIYTTPVVANNVLYIATRNVLYAIAESDE